MDDALGNRLKENYEDRTRYELPRRTYTILRVDGRAFHTYTENLNKPFDEKLRNDLDQTAIFLCKEIAGAKFAYAQSDEISLLITDFDDIKTEAWFDGNVQKMTSVAASIATMAFNSQRASSRFANATFDARVFTIPDFYEADNYFLWRQQDAVRNSLQMLARAHYEHKDLHGKGQAELHDLLHAKGVNWNDLPSKWKRGTFIAKEGEPRRDLSEQFVSPVVNARPTWAIIDCPIFTQDREFLRFRIPRLS